MGKIKHTPKPWKAVRGTHNPDTWNVVGPSVWYAGILTVVQIAYVTTLKLLSGDAEADAHLISAAPDLLTACQEMLLAKDKQSEYYKGLEEGKEPNTDTIANAIIDNVLAEEKARLAISKALGEV